MGQFGWNLQYKAPVLMLHGLWGDEDSFRSMNSFLIANGYPNDLTYVADYQSSNDISFYDNRFTVPTKIDNLILLARENGFSAAKVDIIAHSMGGILSRQYIQSTGFMQKENVNKLITLNTPHSGSPFGNLRTNSTVGFVFRTLGNLIANNRFGGSVNNGAVDDLAIDSQAMNSLNSPPELNRSMVPSNTVITLQSTYYQDTYW